MFWSNECNAQSSKSHYIDAIYYSNTELDQGTRFTCWHYTLTHLVCSTLKWRNYHKEVMEIRETDGCLSWDAILAAQQGHSLCNRSWQELLTSQRIVKSTINKCRRSLRWTPCPARRPGTSPKDINSVWQVSVWFIASRAVVSVSNCVRRMVISTKKKKRGLIRLRTWTASGSCF